MKFAARLKGFSDQELVEGGEPAQRRAQDELNREQQLRIAMTSGWPELPRSELGDAHMGMLVHEPSGEYWVIARGVMFGGEHDSAEAFFIAKDGSPVFLERPSGPKSKAELEQQRAEREERRNAPKPRPSWMTR